MVVMCTSRRHTRPHWPSIALSRTRAATSTRCPARRSFRYASATRVGVPCSSGSASGSRPSARKNASMAAAALSRFIKGVYQLRCSEATRAGEHRDVARLDDTVWVNCLRLRASYSSSHRAVARRGRREKSDEVHGSARINHWHHFRARGLWRYQPNPSRRRRCRCGCRVLNLYPPHPRRRHDQ